MPEVSVRPKGLSRLGAVVAKRVAELEGGVNPDLAGDESRLRALLKKNGRRAFRPLLEFDQRYGGIVLSNSDGWFWVFGAHACLSSGEGIVDSPRKLVPIVIGSDSVGYMDSRGTIWGQSLVVDAEPHPFAPDGDALIARTVLHDMSWSHQVVRRFARIEGKHGARIARELGLSAVRRGNDATWRGWIDAKRVVIQTTDETGKSWTTVAGRGAKRFAKLAR